jgi:hypothetical protein
MNERIKELAEQATTYYNGGLGTEIESFDKEKFAELIVKECIDIVEGIPPGYHDHLVILQDYSIEVEDAFRRDCVDSIKHKFGVEE